MPLPPPTVIELRQYTLQPGQRETLIALFEREFIETQEAQGLQVLGIFRDAERDDRFVWLRGFADMATRGRGLAAFYGGPVWQAHRDAANATMIDSDDVLLLRPLVPWVPPAEAGGAWQILVWRRPDGFSSDALCDSAALWFETETAPNNFPRLPVREGEPVLVGFALFDSPAAFDLFARSGAWARDAQPALAPWLARPAETHRLVPTLRSALHA